MRTALWLLGGLALLTAIATAVPQSPNVPGTVEAWRAGDQGPGRAVAEIFAALGFFDVYGSTLFLLLLFALFLSLTACLVPRIRAWIRLVRYSQPPLARHLPDDPGTFDDRGVDEVLADAAELLRARRWRVRLHPGDAGARAQVAAERGLWTREGGSLLFHLSFYVLLAAIVAGQLLTFEAQRGVIEGEPGFTDTEVSYWSYRPGRWVDADDHAGWRLDLDEFHVDWIRDPLAPGAGQPTEFRSEVTITPAGGAEPFAAEIEGNHPLVVDGRKIHQLDWGYAPFVEVVVDGEVVHAAFITTVVGDDGIYRGAVKAPAATPDVGLSIELYPYAPDGPDGIPRLTGAPWSDAPVMVYEQWRGDLQLGATQQLVTELDTTALAAEGWGFLRPGDEVVIGDVTVRFVELRRWVGFQVSHRPQLPWLLVGSALLVAGLVPALYASRRRVWVTVERDQNSGRTLVHAFGRAFQRPEAFTVELARLKHALFDRSRGG